MSTLFLHIGTSKTGTTSLQRFLYDNKELLLTKNFLFYSRIEEKDNYLNSIHLPYLFYFDESFRWLEHKNNIINEVDRQTFKENIIFKFTKEFKKYPNHNWIISSEHVFNMCFDKDSIEALQNFFLKYFDNIKIVIYLRDQLSYFLSSYSTQVDEKFLRQRKLSLKNLDISLQNPSTSKDLYYDKSLKNFIKYFGQDNILPIIYSSSLQKDNMLNKSFLSTLNINDFDKFHFSTNLNTRSSLKLIKLKLYFNSLIESDINFYNHKIPNIRHKINTFLSSLDNTNQKFLPSRSIYKIWSDEFFNSNKELGLNFFSKKRHLFSQNRIQSFIKNKKKSLNQYDYIEQFQDSLSDNEKNIISLYLEAIQKLNN
tara:strand:+ start:598 stop:1704 length:1107 start_codon:yes stop_codon:yes gene_type:complete